MSLEDEAGGRVPASVINGLLLEMVQSGAVAVKLVPGEARAQMTFVKPSEMDTFLNYREAVLARLKIMAGIDPTEKVGPQTGRIRLDLGDEPREFFVQVVPWGDEGESITVSECALSPDGDDQQVS